MSLDKYWKYSILIVLIVIMQSCSFNIIGCYYKRGQKEDSYLYIDKDSTFSINYRSMFSNYWVRGKYTLDKSGRELTLFKNNTISIGSVNVHNIGNQNEFSLISYSISPSNSRALIDSVVINVKNQRISYLYNDEDTIMINGRNPFSVSFFYNNDSIVYKMNKITDIYFPNENMIYNINLSAESKDTFFFKIESSKHIKSLNNSKYTKINLIP